MAIEVTDIEEASAPPQEEPPEKKQEEEPAETPPAAKRGRPPRANARAPLRPKLFRRRDR